MLTVGLDEDIVWEYIFIKKRMMQAEINQSLLFNAPWALTLALRGRNTIRQGTGFADGNLT